MSLFPYLCQSYGPSRLDLRKSFISTQFDRFSPNFIFAFTLTRVITRPFSHICTRVMARDLCQNFISVQYLENKYTDFHQILYMHSY